MSHRGAFTLVELMVVITIMAALMALTASAVLKFIGVQQTSNTQSTLDRVQSQLNKAWSKAKDAANAETIPIGVKTWIQTNLTSSDANVEGRVRVIYVKLRMRQQFPMNFAEALNVAYYNPSLNVTVQQSPLPPLPGYVSYLANLGIQIPPSLSVIGTTYVPQPYESSVCLLMALQRGVSGAGIDPAELTSGGAAGNAPYMNPPPPGAWPVTNLQPAVITNIPYLTDSWGRAIFFSRAPAGSPYLNPAFPTGWPGANDPGDPQGYLQSQGWGTTYGPLFTTLTLQVIAPPNSSYKLAPMVASGGPSDWTVRGTVATPASSFNPITFAPVLGSDALFSTP